MNFNKYYRQQIIPAWSSKYIDYDHLKRLIEKIAQAYAKSNVHYISPDHDQSSTKKDKQRELLKPVSSLQELEPQSAMKELYDQANKGLGDRHNLDRNVCSPKKSARATGDGDDAAGRESSDSDNMSLDDSGLSNDLGIDSKTNTITNYNNNNNNNNNNNHGHATLNLMRNSSNNSNNNKSEGNYSIDNQASGIDHGTIIEDIDEIGSGSGSGDINIDTNNGKLRAQSAGAGVDQDQGIMNIKFFRAKSNTHTMSNTSGTTSPVISGKSSSRVGIFSALGGKSRSGHTRENSDDFFDHASHQVNPLNTDFTNVSHASTTLVPVPNNVAKNGMHAAGGTNLGVVTEEDAEQSQGGDSFDAINGVYNSGSHIGATTVTTVTTATTSSSNNSGDIAAREHALSGQATRIIKPKIGVSFPTKFWLDNQGVRIIVLENEFIRDFMTDIYKVSKFYSEECEYFGKQINMLISNTKKIVELTSQIKEKIYQQTQEMKLLTRKKSHRNSNSHSSNSNSHNTNHNHNHSNQENSLSHSSLSVALPPGFGKVASNSFHTTTNRNSRNSRNGRNGNRNRNTVTATNKNGIGNSDGNNSDDTVESSVSRSGSGYGSSSGSTGTRGDTTTDDEENSMSGYDHHKHDYNSPNKNYNRRMLRIRRRTELKISIDNLKQRQKLLAHERNKLRLLYRQMYHAITMLDEYRMLNITAMLKISKKHDLNSEWKECYKEICSYKDNECNFSSPHGSGGYENHLLKRLERTYCTLLYDINDEYEKFKRNAKEAKQELTETVSRKKVQKESCLIGLFSGFSIAIQIITIILVLYSIQYGFFDDPKTKNSWFIYRGSFLICLYLWLYGVDVVIWEKYNFNHVLMLEADPSRLLRSPHIWRVASLGTFLTLIFALLYVVVWTFGFEREDIKQCICDNNNYDYNYNSTMNQTTTTTILAVNQYQITPSPTWSFEKNKLEPADSDVGKFLSFNPMWATILLFLGWVVFATYPGKTYLPTRAFLFRSFSKQMRAPIPKVRFIDNFIADQWTSLFTIVVDFAFATCFVTAGKVWDINDNGGEICTDNNILRGILKILRLYPYWVRFAQCIRKYRDSGAKKDIANAGKYTFALLAIVVGTAYDGFGDASDDENGLLAAHIVLAAIATCYAYYWDLVHDWDLFQPNDRNPWLRERTTFPDWVYYIASILDLIFRVSWAFGLFASQSEFVDLHYFSLPLAACEVIRRCMWNVLRMEKEHITNCSEFRVVHDVPELNKKIYGKKKKNEEKDTEKNKDKEKDKQKAKEIEMGENDYSGYKDTVDTDTERERDKRGFGRDDDSMNGGYSESGDESIAVTDIFANKLNVHIDMGQNICNLSHNHDNSNDGGDENNDEDGSDDGEPAVVVNAINEKAFNAKKYNSNRKSKSKSKGLVGIAKGKRSSSKSNKSKNNNNKNDVIAASPTKEQYERRRSTVFGYMSEQRNEFQKTLNLYASQHFTNSSGSDVDSNDKIDDGVLQIENDMITDRSHSHSQHHNHHGQQTLTGEKEHKENKENNKDNDYFIEYQHTRNTRQNRMQVSFDTGDIGLSGRNSNIISFGNGINNRRNPHPRTTNADHNQSTTSPKASSPAGTATTGSIRDWESPRVYSDDNGLNGDAPKMQMGLLFRTSIAGGAVENNDDITNKNGINHNRGHGPIDNGHLTGIGYGNQLQLTARVLPLNILTKQDVVDDLTVSNLELFDDKMLMGYDYALNSDAFREHNSSVRANFGSPQPRNGKTKRNHHKRKHKRKHTHRHGHRHRGTLKHKAKNGDDVGDGGDDGDNDNHGFDEEKGKQIEQFKQTHNDEKQNSKPKQALNARSNEAGDDKDTNSNSSINKNNNNNNNSSNENLNDNEDANDNKLALGKIDSVTQFIQAHNKNKNSNNQRNDEEKASDNLSMPGTIGALHILGGKGSLSTIVSAVSFDGASESGAQSNEINGVNTNFNDKNSAMKFDTRINSIGVINSRILPNSKK